VETGRLNRQDATLSISLSQRTVSMSSKLPARTSGCKQPV